MIPPSNHLIIYGLVAEQSIPRLFLAGFALGILVGILLLLVTWIIARKRNYGGAANTFSLGPLLKAIWDGKWAIGAPVIILGGIYAGIFTPTEAAAVAVFYGLFVGVVVYRKLGLKAIYESLKFTALMVGGILLILGSTKAFGPLVAFYDIPQSIETLLMGVSQNSVIILLIVGAFYIFVGMWLESIPQIIIFTPVLLPIAVGLGVDPVLFGIITVMTCEVGFLSPPIGANLFVAAKLTNLSIEEISWAVIPFMIPYILCLVLLAFFSGWVLFLPNIFFGAG
jgi:C4-dicarboxylate transporter DctM subunit